MDLSRVNIHKMTWTATSPKYKKGSGFYTLDKNKRVVKSKTSFNCWLKKGN